MSFYTGSGVTFQIGKETAWGTAVPGTALVDLTSESLALSVEKGDEGSLLASKTAMARDLKAINVDGSVDFVLRPEFAGMLLKAAFGGTDVVAGSGSSFTHTMVLAGTNESLPSLTAIVDRKHKVSKYAGLTISSLTLTCPAQDYVTGSVSFIGKNEEVGTLSPGLGLSIPAFRCTSAKMTVAGNEIDVITATFTLDNALENAPKTYKSGLFQGKPQPSMRTVTISFETPANEISDSLKDSYLITETNAEVVLEFTSTTDDYKITITMPNVSIQSVDDSVSGTGAITASFDGIALSVGNTEPVTCVLKDKTATAY